MRVYSQGDEGFTYLLVGLRTNGAITSLREMAATKIIKTRLTVMTHRVNVELCEITVT